MVRHRPSVATRAQTCSSPGTFDFSLFAPHCCGLRRPDLRFQSVFLQLFNFRPRQVAEGPLRQIAENKIAGLDPLQFNHRMTDAVEHAPDLAFSAFMDRDLQPGIRFFLADLLELRGRSLAVVEIDTLLEQVDLLVREHTLHLRTIGLGEFMLRVSNKVRKIPIVREEQQALGVVVQPPHGIDANL